jgi:prevent-host-death family protein
MNHQPRVWPLQEAKAKFSELVRLAQTEGPQTVTVHGQPAVTITKVGTAGKVLSGLTGADFLKAMQAGPKFDLEIPPRPKNGKFREFSFD